MTTVFMWAFFDGKKYFNILFDLIFLILIHAGGPKNFICGDETNFWKVIEHYGNSTRSIVQYSLWILFSTCCSSSFCLFSFNLFCNSTRFFHFSTMSAPRSVCGACEITNWIYIFIFFFTDLILHFSKSLSPHQLTH